MSLRSRTINYHCHQVKFGAVASICPPARAPDMRYPLTPTSAANIGRYVGELTRWQSIYGVELRTIHDKTSSLDCADLIMTRRPHPRYCVIMYLAVIL